MTKKRRDERTGGVLRAIFGLVAIIVGASFAGSGCGDESPHNTGTGASSGGEETCFGDADCVNFSGCFESTGQSCECTRIVCSSGKCIPFGPLAAETPAKTQSKDDCKRMVCDGQGVAMAVDDPLDFTADTNECTDDLCSNGMPAHPPSAEGTPCSLGLCNGQGQCIQCIDTTQCSDGTICLASLCVPPSCGNGIFDGTETDVDCGSSCAPCANGKKCTKNDDCQSGLCADAICK